MPYVALRREVHDAVRVAEDAPPLPPEIKLQSLWFAGAFGREFATTAGVPVRVVQFGEWNHSAGPDFLDAVVEVGGRVWRGPIELDAYPSDWEGHGHADNPAFREVVLHVVFASGRREHFTRTLDHREVPCVLVPQDLLDEALDHPLHARADSRLGRCSEPLRDLAAARIDDLLVEAARYRAERKARHLQRLEDSHGFEEALWQSLARALGYGPNKLTMTLLGQRVPRRALRDLRTNLAREALLFGTAGFLAPDLHEKAPPDSRRYLRGLWRDWWRLRPPGDLDPSRRLPWRFGGTRPGNHPHRRLGALAAASAVWPRLANPAREGAPARLARLRERLVALAHDFWTRHYTLHSRPAARPVSLCGAARANEFLANYYIPSWWRRDPAAAWAAYRKLPAGTVSDPVRRAAARLLGDRTDAPSFLKGLWRHQALLQVYHDFCLEDASDCHECPFPEQLFGW